MLQETVWPLDGKSLRLFCALIELLGGVHCNYYHPKGKDWQHCTSSQSKGWTW